MTFGAVLLLAALGIPVAAVASWLIYKIEPDWTARQRVFNSAAILPAILAVGAASFALVTLFMDGSPPLRGALAFLLQALTAVLAAFNAGLIAAYLVDKYINAR